MYFVLMVPAIIYQYHRVITNYIYFQKHEPFFGLEKEGQEKNLTAIIVYTLFAFSISLLINKPYSWPLLVFCILNCLIIGYVNISLAIKAQQETKRLIIKDTLLSFSGFILLYFGFIIVK